MYIRSSKKFTPAAVANFLGNHSKILVKSYMLNWSKFLSLTPLVYIV